MVGGGIAGLRAALGLAEIGLGVFLVERSAELGGWVGGLGEMYPHGKDGRELVAGLLEEVRARPDVTLLTNAEVVGKSGSFGNYVASIRVQGEHGPETIEVEVGAIIVATGFDAYQPDEGEYGYGIEGVVTLPEFEQLLAASDRPLELAGRPVRSIGYVYCIGSRQPDGNAYCSRYCCPATIPRFPARRRS